MQRGLGERAGGCQQGGLEGWLWQGGFECMVVVVGGRYRVYGVIDFVPIIRINPITGRSGHHRLLGQGEEEAALLRASSSTMVPWCTGP